MSMPDFGFKIGDLEIILQIFSGFPEITKASIFGSRARGDYKKGSDTDIVVWITGADIIPQLSGILNDETLLPYKFDILDYNKISNSDLKYQIDLHEIEIYFKK
jgi:predicted nucleotidyltransferase